MDRFWKIFQPYQPSFRPSLNWIFMGEITIMCSQNHPKPPLGYPTACRPACSERPEREHMAKPRPLVKGKKYQPQMAHEKVFWDSLSLIAYYNHTWQQSHHIISSHTTKDQISSYHVNFLIFLQNQKKTRNISPATPLNCNASFFRSLGDLFF